MILIVTNKEDFTADHVIVELHKQKIPFFRLNTEDFPFSARINWHEGNSKRRFYTTDSKQITFSDISSIWYRRPKKPLVEGLSSDQQNFVESETQNMFSGIWRTLDCLWVSHPDDIRKASSKIDQLYYAKKYGFRIPETLITNDPIESLDFYKSIDGKTIVKPINKSHITTENGEKIIFSNIIEETDLKYFEQIQNCPIMIQKYIPKKFDIRVNIFGKSLYATEIHSQQFQDKINIDWRRGATRPIVHKSHKLPENIQNQCMKIVEHYSLNFSAIDLILSPDGVYHFLEINPNGQWAWIEPLTGQPMTKSLIEMLMS